MRRILSAMAMLLCSITLSAQKGSIEANSREDLLSKIGVPTVYVLSEFEECRLYQVVLMDARAEGDEYLLYPHEAGILSDPLFMSRVFRGLRSATRDSVP